MKKIYITPTITVVKLKRRPQLLNASVKGFGRSLVNDSEDYDDDGGAAL